MENAGLLSRYTPEELTAVKLALFAKASVECRRDEFISYVPHKGQAPMHFDHDWNYYVISAGQRSGKTLSAALEQAFVLGLKNSRSWIVAPNYDLGERAFEMVFEFVVRQKIHGEGSVKSSSFSKGNQHIEMAWGSWVRVKSAENPESLVGEQLDFILFDEAARCTEKIFLQYLEPRTLNRMGRTLMVSSPQGFNWFRAYWERGLNTEQIKKGWRNGHFRSADNPFISKPWLDSKRAETPEHIWRQEYDGEFEQFSGLIYPDYVDRLYDPSSPASGGHLYDPKNLQLPAEWTRYRGIDIGFRHPTVCLWPAIDDEGNAYFYQEYSQQNVVHDDHAQAIAALTTHPIQTTWMSPDAKRKNPLMATAEDRLSVWDVYRRNGIVAKPAATDVDAGIAVVSRYLRATLEDAPNHPKVLISLELAGLRKGLREYVFAEHHAVRDIDAPDKPRKYQDDFVDAFRYSLASRPQYIPYWQREGVEYDDDRYGYKNSRFKMDEREARTKRQRIPGMAYSPR